MTHDGPNLDGFARYLTLLALFGCARHDATPHQLARLRDEAVPMLKDLERPPSDCAQHVFDIMGVDTWDPTKTGDGHGAWLAKLLDDPRRADGG